MPKIKPSSTPEKKAAPAASTAKAPKAAKASKTAKPAKPAKTQARKSRLNLIKHDPWLEPYSEAIEGRHEDAIRKEKELTGSTSGKKLDELPTPTTISGCITPPTAAGCSANGPRTRRPSP